MRLAQWTKNQSSTYFGVVVQIEVKTDSKIVIWGCWASSIAEMNNVRKETLNCPVSCSLEAGSNSCEETGPKVSWQTSW